MKARLEKQPFQINKGVELTSENDTEKLRLECLWRGHGGPVGLTRNLDGSRTIVFTPSLTDDSDYQKAKREGRVDYSK